ncbi:MAG: MFS transporter, partial [Planctomycetales bacterium]|nr:MFS transporter [Planctomycetales bacterium]
ADSPEQATWLSNEERAYLVAQQAEDVAQRGNLPRYTLWQALTNAEVVRLCVIYYLWLTGYWGFNYWMPSVLKSASGWSNIAVGWMIVIPMCLSLAFMIFIGDSSSRSGEKRWHGAIGLFIAAIGMFVGTMTERPAIAFAMMCFTAIGVYAPFGVWWSYPTTFLSGSAAAGAIGLINSLGNLGGFCGPYLTGKLKESTGSFQSAWWFLGTSLFVAGLLMLTLKQNVDARAKG